MQTGRYRRGGQTDRQTGRQMEIDRQTDKKTKSKTDGQMHKQTSKQEEREVGKKLTNGPGVSPMFILREGLFNNDRETPTVKYIQQ